MLIALDVQNKWKIHQIKVKSVFLNEVIEEDVYVKQPLSYVKKIIKRKYMNFIKLFMG